MKRLTSKQALAIARKKWKDKEQAAHYKVIAGPRFDVGYVSPYGFAHISGSGATWEEALTKAGALKAEAMEGAE